MRFLTVTRDDLAEAWPRLVALVVFAGALAAQRTALAELAGDDGLFVVVGRALAHGHLVYAHLPGAPPAVGIGPIYPAVMALVTLAWPAYPANETLAALVDAACLAGAAFLTVRLLGSQAGRLTRYVAVPAAFLAFPVLAEAGARQGMPELFLLAMASGAVLRADVTPRRAALAGALAGAAVLVLNAGIGAVAGVAAWTAVRNRRAAAASLAASLGVIGPWAAWGAFHAPAAAAWFVPSFWFETGVLAHALSAFALVATTLLGGPASGAIVIVALSALALRGWLVNPSLPGATGPVMGGVALAALLLPVSTNAVWIGIVWALLGLGAALDRAQGPERRVLQGAGLIALATLAVRDVAAFRGHGPVPPALEDARNRDVQVAAFGVEPSPGVVATNHAPRFYLLTGREVVPPFAPGESVPSADTLLRRYCDVHVGVVAVTDSASTAAAAVRAIRAARPEALQPLYELSTGIALYRLTCAQ